MFSREIHSIRHCCFRARLYITMRHAALAWVSRSRSVIARRLVAQYSDVPSMARTRNTLISPKPLSQQIVPSPPVSPTSTTAYKLPPLNLICRFDLSRVKKCQSKARISFKFSTEAYQLSKQTNCGLNPRSNAFSSMSKNLSFWTCYNSLTKSL